jgi:hypothetical protein
LDEAEVREGELRAALEKTLEAIEAWKVNPLAYDYRLHQVSRDFAPLAARAALAKDRTE